MKTERVLLGDVFCVENVHSVLTVVFGGNVTKTGFWSNFLLQCFVVNARHEPSSVFYIGLWLKTDKNKF